MKAFKKLWRLIILSATLTVALCACGGDKAGDASSHITIGIPQDLSDTSRNTGTQRTELDVSLKLRNRPETKNPRFLVCPVLSHWKENGGARSKSRSHCTTFSLLVKWCCTSPLAVSQRAA